MDEVDALFMQQLFTECLLFPDVILGAWATAVNKTDNTLCSYEAYILCDNICYRIEILAQYGSTDPEAFLKQLCACF